MVKFFYILLFCAFASVAYAQEAAVPEKILNELAKDLAVFNREVLKAQEVQRAGKAVGFLPNRITITTESASIRAGASHEAAVVTTASSGQVFQVIDKVDNWYAVQRGKESLGWVEARWAKPLAEVQGRPALRVEANEGVFRALTRSAAKMHDKYKNNPYLTVKGFSVSLGLPTSVNVSFEFK